MTEKKHSDTIGCVAHFQKTIYGEGSWRHGVRKSDVLVENSFRGWNGKNGRKKLMLFTTRDLNILLNAEGGVFLLLEQQKRLVNSVDVDLQQAIEFVHFGLDLWWQQSRCAEVCGWTKNAKALQHTLAVQRSIYFSHRPSLPENTLEQRVLWRWPSSCTRQSDSFSRDR